MSEVTKLAWRVFRDTFKEGEEVVVEDSMGNFYWGKMYAQEDYLRLTRPGGWSKDIDWEEVEFICHDGFPVDHIFGMTQEEAAERARRTTRSIIHEYLDHTVKPIYGGCPWVAQGSLVEILNPGSMSYGDDCEIIVLANGDARFHSYWTDHLFLEA